MQQPLERAAEQSSESVRKELFQMRKEVKKLRRANEKRAIEALASAQGHDGDINGRVQEALRNLPPGLAKVSRAVHVKKSWMLSNVWRRPIFLSFYPSSRNWPNLQVLELSESATGSLESLCSTRSESFLRRNLKSRLLRHSAFCPPKFVVILLPLVFS